MSTIITNVNTSPVTSPEMAPCWLPRFEKTPRTRIGEKAGRGEPADGQKAHDPIREARVLGGDKDDDIPIDGAEHLLDRGAGPPARRLNQSCLRPALDPAELRHAPGSHLREGLQDLEAREHVDDRGGHRVKKTRAQTADQRALSIVLSA